MKISTEKQPSAKRAALENIASELGRLQGQARSAGETFVAFLIASAQREAAVRYAELGGLPDSANTKVSDGDVDPQKNR